MKKNEKNEEEKWEKNLKKNNFSNALSHHCTVAWVTRPERPKGVKVKVKQAQRAQSQVEGPSPT